MLRLVVEQPASFFGGLLSMPRYASDTPLGFSKARLRRTRQRRGLTDLVEIHHVVPREFRNHPVLLGMGYDVEGDYNTIFVPTSRGARLGPGRPVHTGGHMAYNAHIREQLNEAVTDSTSFAALLCVLFSRSRGRSSDVPWAR